ncbi:MAG: TetR/AcrR family transcriptional regulator [Deltaproteobacteria bacterium]|nr:TetR/AcrR family transcriptional regulator [Deltaproteobacteria bacterium]
MSTEELERFQAQIHRLEREGRVTRTFRRLDAERQWAVITALLEDAAESGPDALGVKRVAARAGVAVGSLYQYFPRREGMLDFAAEVSASFLIGSLENYQEALAALPLREALSAYLAGGVEWSREHAGLLRFFARVAYHGDPDFRDRLVRPVSLALRSLVRAMLEGARARGELREGLDLEAAVRMLHALTLALGDAELLPHLNEYFLLFDEAHLPPRVREAVIALAVRALAREVTPRRRHHGRARAGR